MSAALKDLLNLLDLEQIEVNLFRGVSPEDSWQRVYGGQVLGQALVAAARTVEGRLAHSLHAYFLRPGDPKVPILYEVDRSRDGNTFTNRRVVAIQHGKQIFNMAVSFHAGESGLAHQFDMPDIPGPDDLPSEQERRREVAPKLPEEYRKWFSREQPIDTRLVDYQDLLHPKKVPPFQNVWVRAAGDLPDDPALHQCIMAYASDMTLIDTIIFPHGVSWLDDQLQTASLDHAMWFHRPFRADEWLLYAQDSPASFGGRGLSRGSFYSQDGTLVASVAQEGLIRFHTDDS